MDVYTFKRKRFSCRQFIKELVLGFVTQYETPKIVMIHSYAITTLLRLMQIILLSYSIFWLLLYEKGYQKQDSSIISSVTLKVKGIGLINTPENETYVLDGSDYIIPPSENNAIFIMTNFILTDQSRSACTEVKSMRQAECGKDSDCRNKAFMPDANGRWTGRCILPSEVTYSNKTKNSTGLCELQGWCPVEDDSQKRTIIQGIRNFTIFIKNFIEFPAFNVKHKNMVDNLKSCVYHPTEHSDCPIFRLDHILKSAEDNATERDLMLKLGGVIRVKLDWDCNLDRSIKLCKPEYSFARLDTQFSKETFSPGFNFRFASHWKYGGSDLRSLKKAFGLRLIISVSGKAGKFDFITLTLNTGSLVGIFGLATFFCDLVLLNLTKKASVYRNYVFQRVDSEVVRRNSTTSSNKRPSRPVGRIFEDENFNHLSISNPLWTIDSLERFSDVSSSPYQSRIIPNVGVTNAV